MDKNANNHSGDGQGLARKLSNPVRRATAIAVLVVIIASSYACTIPTVPRPAQGTIPCNGEGGKFTCDGLSNHQITLSNVPPDVTPHLLPVSPEEEERLREADKDGTGCIISIVGDLAFYDNDNALVTSFDSPISVSYRFLEEDNDKFKECKNSLVEQGTVTDPADVEYQPVAFYDNAVWRPIESYDLKADGVIAFDIFSWGDQQGGFGTKP